MDRHDIAHYMLAGGAIALAALGFHAATNDDSRISNLKAAGAVQEHGWAGLADDRETALSKAVGALPPHAVSVYCMAPTCGDFQDDLVEAFSTGAWSAAEAQAIGGAPAGVELSPNNDEGRVVAKAIESAVHDRFKVGLATIGDSEWAIVIGKRP